MDCVGTSCLSVTNFETFENILRIFENENSCAVVQPTGTGKSYIMMELLKKFKDTWKIVIAPSRDFLNELERNKYWVSDKTLTLTYSVMGLNCDNVTGLLADYKIHPDQIGLIVIDEMHRAGAPKWGAGVRSLMQLCKNAKTLGLTATPKRQDEDRDMVEELFEGRMAKNMNLAEAIYLKLIPQLAYTVGMHDLNINISELRAGLSKDNHMKYIDKMLETYEKKWSFTNYFIHTLSKYIDIKEVGGKHVIFASCIEEAEKMAVVVEKWFRKLYNTKNVKVYCIHSKQAKKSIYMEDFFAPNKVGEVKVAVAVNMLNESFHCKDIKTISMFRGTQSLNVYMQQIGRALSSDGDVPYIFDFVDNYHTIDSLHEMITLNSIIGPEEAYDSKLFVFKEFNDETTEFVRDMHRIKRLINLDTEEVLKEISNKIVDTSVGSDDGIVLSVRDKEFIDWVTYVLNEINKSKFRTMQGNLSDETITNLTISYDINKSLGYDWYKRYRIYIEDKNKLTEQELKTFRAQFNKAFLLNAASDCTVKFFREKGLVSNLTSNEAKLKVLIDKNEPKKFKFKDRLLTIPELANEESEENKFALYKGIIKIEESIDKIVYKNWTDDTLGDACAYWLWKLYKDKYKEQIDKLKDRYKDVLYVDEFISSAKKNKTSTELGLIIKVNSLIENKKGIDELSEEILEILDYHKIKKLSRLYDYICRQLHLDVDESNLGLKLKVQVSNGYIDNKLKKLAESTKKSAYGHLHLDYLEWSDIIMSRYERLIEVCDAIINYNESDSDPESFKWLEEFIDKSKEELAYSKSKKRHLMYDRGTNNKLALAYTTYKDIQSIENELEESYIDNFRQEYSKAVEEWKLHKRIDKHDNLFISLVALSRCKICKENIGTNKLKYNLQKTLVTLFDWLVMLEHMDLNSSDVTENMRSLLLSFELIGDDIIYILASALSKKNRELTLTMYKQFLTTGKILSKNALSFFEETTDRDNQLLYDIKKSKHMIELKTFSEYYNTLVETYETARY